MREHVTLRSAGPGSMKGLCPFHDEKTPVLQHPPGRRRLALLRLRRGRRRHLLRPEGRPPHLRRGRRAARRQARDGAALRGGRRGRARRASGRRSRLIEAHRVAAGVLRRRAAQPAAEARAGRDFLRARGFDSAAATRFGVGFAPRGGEDADRHLRAKGFSDDEIVTGGLAGRGSARPLRPVPRPPGLADPRHHRRHRRASARAASSTTTGSRRSTSTPPRRRSTRSRRVLYGLDLAKKPISRDRQAVVVEGYTDVMACHLAGIETAVATCGTAFGVEHIKMLRRIMRDESRPRAGQGGLHLRRRRRRPEGRDAGVRRGPALGLPVVRRGRGRRARTRASCAWPRVTPAVRALVEDAVPMFEFAVRTTINRFDLDTAEGRVQAMRAAAPIVAGIRDRSLRPEYTRDRGRAGSASRWSRWPPRSHRAGRSTAGGAPGAEPGRTGARRTSAYDGDRRGSHGATDGDGGADHAPARRDAATRPARPGGVRRAAAAAGGAAVPVGRRPGALRQHRAGVVLGPGPPGRPRRGGGRRGAAGRRSDRGVGRQGRRGGGRHGAPPGQRARGGAACRHGSTRRPACPTRATSTSC